MSSRPGLRDPPPAPKTKLGRFRKLAPTAGLHVSPIQLGGMSIGDKWGEYGLGAMDKEKSFKILDAYYEAGGNFIDTANVYQDGTSEEFIGEWAEKRGIRDQLVLATKYSANFQRGVPWDQLPQKAAFTGNNTKSMALSVEASLKKLRTHYIDILYLHWYDYITPVDEIMNSLHNLVVQGKVLYLGISDTPAWVVVKANDYARANGKTPFVIYQGAWNILNRDIEREIIPMVRSEGLALAPWNVLAGGKIRSDADEQRRIDSGEGGRTVASPEWKRNETEREVCRALEKIAAEVGAKNITSVAIAWCMQKFPYVFPIVGGRKVEHLLANLEALDISLSPEQIKFLDGVVPFEKGFPFKHFGDGLEYDHQFKAVAQFEMWPHPQAIRPTPQ